MSPNRFVSLFRGTPNRRPPRRGWARAPGLAFLFALAVAGPAADAARGAEPPPRRTVVGVRGERFLINGEPTYKGRSWRGHTIEGLLFNSRMVQGVFDDLNPETAGQWAYPDTKTWSAERNTREFVAAMPAWRAHGLLAFTLNLQGGSPQGYSRAQPWHNSAFTSSGALRPEYRARAEAILDRADALGMVVILGVFYFGQDERLENETAVLAALDNTLAWLRARGCQNVLVEVNNECDVRYDHAVLRSERVHELIARAQKHGEGEKRFLVGTSYGGGKLPGEKVLRQSDFLLLHGNGVKEPERMAAMVKACRAHPAYREMPILVNEDDHYDFDKPSNNCVAAVEQYASWGFFDFRRQGEPFAEGFQSVPVDWTIGSDRKRGFFGLVKEMTGSEGEAPRPAPR